MSRMPRIELIHFISLFCFISLSTARIIPVLVARFPYNKPHVVDCWPQLDICPFRRAVISSLGGGTQAGMYKDRKLFPASSASPCQRKRYLLTFGYSWLP
jgi:hypothetical protein